MYPRRAVPSFVLLVLLAALSLPAHLLGQGIPSPEEFFGFQMGADRKLAHWDQLLEYYDLLDEQSDRIHVMEMGESTLGNRFITLFISSPENLARLDELKELNAILSDPRGHSEAEIDNAIENGKVVFVQSYGLHSSEVAASQGIAEITYEFATKNDEVTLEILDNAIAIVIPCLNPDGEIMITEWYNRWVGTEYEGAGMPWLYHHYIGHDNNRDAFMRATIESEYGARIMFREWVPQGYIDHHQMGSYTARMAIPPYAEPIRPEADPLVWREMSWYGAHIGYKMDEADLKGAIGAAIYSGWGHFGFHWITPFHNIAGMLTEGASARLATPIYIHPDQLGGSRQFPEYEEQTTFPNPWPGGWWHVRDIVEMQKVATVAPLEIAAKNRKTVLLNAYNKSSRQIQRGLEGEVKAYVIPSQQHDPLTMQKLVNKLLGQGVTVERAQDQFIHEGRVYGGGSYVVSMAQPKRGLIRWVLGQTYYPDNSFTRDSDGNPIRPYDLSTDNFAEFMGVRADPVKTAVTAPLATVTDWLDPDGEVMAGAGGYRLDGQLNDAFHAVNLLFDAGASVRRVAHGGEGVEAGDFIVDPEVSPSVVADVAAETGVGFEPLSGEAPAASYPLEKQRIGMYHRYLGGNMDEGWTRLLLENFGFEYTKMLDGDILAGDLSEKYDVIVLAADSKGMMTGIRGGGGGGYGRGGDPSTIPPEYRSGFGQAGIDALNAFVRNGGTLVTFAQAGDLAIDEFNLPVRNAVAGMWGNEFWSPGSTLKVNVNNQNPYAFGMPEDALALFLAQGQVYETVSGPASAGVSRIVTYQDRDILQSGWLLGEEAIANKAAVVSVEHGEGTVVLIGFRAQHRTQTHGTFKLFFNALMTIPEGH
ncbi:MAG: peptidase M14 family protein [Gemmatimonadetes bacterium]|nr:peptidase M14 family protein [Gemmatimonadota bacterium]